MIQSDFFKAVAERAGEPLHTARRVLREYGVKPSVAPPRGRPLRIRRISYAGSKNEDGLAVPFDFEWSTPEDGLYVLATDGNSAGKTTTLQAALWALRGAEENMSEPARSWISDVEVDFEIDGQSATVSFSKSNGDVSGTIKIGDEKITFSSTDEFEGAMQSIMFMRLDLEAIASSQAQANGVVSPREDGWKAYTHAFLSDARSNAIIGQSIPGLTVRLLEVFLGLPWATTIFEASAALKVVKSKTEERTRRLAFLGGKSPSDLESEIREIDETLASVSVSSEMAKKYAFAERAYKGSMAPLQRAREGLNFAEEELAAAKLEAAKAKKAQLLIEQGAAATDVMGNLNPSRCPHCSEALDEERRAREEKDGICQLCARAILRQESSDAAELLQQTRVRVKRAINREKDAELLALEAQKTYDELRRQRAILAENLKSLEAFGTARDVEELQLKRAKASALLSAARDIVGDEITGETDLKVLRAAEAEAKARADEAGRDVLRRVSEEIRLILNRIGMPAVMRVALKRNCQVEVEQGGETTNWGKLSAGQQLRLRIAAVLALIKCAEEYGVGRHPGLLLIDSPGNEEMEPGDLASLLSEVAMVARDVPVQIFVAMRGLSQARAVVSDARLKTPSAGTRTLW